MSEASDIEAQVKEVRAEADRIKKKYRRKAAANAALNSPNAVVMEIPKGSSHSFHSFGTKDNRTSKSTNTTTSFLVSVDPSLISMVHGDEEEDEINKADRGRQSDLCCGFCCDLVKACLIVNGLYAFILTFLLTVSLLEVPYIDLAFKLNASSEYYDDDYYADAFLDRNGVIDLVQTCAGIAFALTGVLGAAQFESPVVIVTCVGYVLYSLSSIARGRYPGALLAGFMAYPNIALYLAIRSGSMTREAYEKGTEAHCCCDRNR